jgi:hypothetical protein
MVIEKEWFMILKLSFNYLTSKDEIVYEDQDKNCWMDLEAKKWSNPVLYKIQKDKTKVFIGDLPDYYKNAEIEFPNGRMVWEEIGLVITNDFDIIKNTQLQDEAEAYRYLDQLKTKLFCDELIKAIQISKKCLRDKLMSNEIKLHCGVGDVIQYRSVHGDDFEFTVGKIVIENDGIKIYDQGDRGCIVCDNQYFDKYCKVIRRYDETVQGSDDTGVPVE